MIYDLIVASASRPHLLRRTLTSLLANVDVQPRCVFVHDDAVFHDQRDAVLNAVHDGVRIARTRDASSVQVLGTAIAVDPPRRHGPALAWLLAQTDAEFVLYTQDDHETVRPVPLARALDFMRARDLNQIRFNKRATLDYKDTWQGRWHKKEFLMAMSVPLTNDGQRMLVQQHFTVSDHWYFQTSLWRTSVIKPAVLALHEAQPDAFKHRCEDQINDYLDDHCARTHGLDARDPDVRAKYLRTFIYGKIGDERYVQHIGDQSRDFARPRDVWET